MCGVWGRVEGARGYATVRGATIASSGWEAQNKEKELDKKSERERADGKVRT